MLLYIYPPDSTAGTNPEFFEAFTSLRWRRKYADTGEIELHAAATADNIELFTPGSIISRDDRPEIAEITGIELAEGKIKATGKMLTRRLGERVIPNFTATGEAGALICEAASRAGMAVRRKEQVKDRYSVLTLYKSAETIARALAAAASIGFRAVMDGAGVYVIETYAGRDCTQSVVFSYAEKNLNHPYYTYTEEGYANTAIVAGEGEGDARTVVREPESVTGERAREIYVDARDLKQEEGQTQAEYIAALRQRGREKLAEHGLIENFEASIVLDGRYTYTVDWDLGDIVTVQHEPWGKVQNLRVSEVEEVYESGICTVTPVLGSPIPETLDFGS